MHHPFGLGSPGERTPRKSALRHVDSKPGEFRSWLRINPQLRKSAALLPNRDGRGMTRPKMKAPRQRILELPTDQVQGPRACQGRRPAADTQLHVDVAQMPFDRGYLPVNVGANGFYGHRVYAAFPHLVNEDFVLFLDQDNWFEPGHVASCIGILRSRALHWCYSLRNICAPDGTLLCPDDWESLGKWPAFTNDHLIDTSTYCFRREVLIQTCSAWHGGWGQDRVFAKLMMQNVPSFDCTGEYTVNYRLGGNQGSVTEEFFVRGNRQMRARYDKRLPWQAR